MIPWEDVGKVWALLIGFTILFQMYKWIMKETKK
jgi:hypothetical protein